MRYHTHQRLRERFHSSRKWLNWVVSRSRRFTLLGKCYSIWKFRSQLFFAEGGDPHLLRRWYQPEKSTWEILNLYDHCYYNISGLFTSLWNPDVMALVRISFCLKFRINSRYCKNRNIVAKGIGILHSRLDDKFQKMGD